MTSDWIPGGPNAHPNFDLGPGTWEYKPNPPLEDAFSLGGPSGNWRHHPLPATAPEPVPPGEPDEPDEPYDPYPTHEPTYPHPLPPDYVDPDPDLPYEAPDEEPLLDNRRRHRFEFGANQDTFELAKIVFAALIAGHIEVNFSELLRAVTREYDSLPKNMPKEKKKGVVMKKLKKEIAAVKAAGPKRLRVRKNRGAAGGGMWAGSSNMNIATANGGERSMVAGALATSGCTPYWRPKSVKSKAGREGLEVEFCQMIYAVGSLGSIIAANGVVMNNSTPAQLVTAGLFDPNLTTYMDKHLLFESSLWAKYRLKKLKFKYKPIGATTSTGIVLCLGANSDPSHPSIAGSPPLRPTMLASGAVEGAYWEDLSLEVSDLDQAWRFCYDTAATDVRFEAAAAFVIISPSGAPANASWGNLYAEGVIEYADPSPVATSVSFESFPKRPESLGDREIFMRQLRRKQYLEDMKEQPGNDVTDGSYDVEYDGLGRASRIVPHEIPVPPGPDDVKTKMSFVDKALAALERAQNDGSVDPVDNIKLCESILSKLSLNDFHFDNSETKSVEPTSLRGARNDSGDEPKVTNPGGFVVLKSPSLNSDRRTQSLPPGSR